MDKQARFAACLLMVGPPTQIQRLWKAGLPVFTTPAYEFDCKRFYMAHCHEGAWIVGEPTEFTQWFKEYKRWLWETKHG